ncbi:MAG: hypothetical protein ACRDOH_18365 [Streptosporangiaceae bacterium]
MNALPPGHRADPIETAWAPPYVGDELRQVRTAAWHARLDSLRAGHRDFAHRLADRQSQTIPSEDPGYGDLGQAFPTWTGRARSAILQPPKPEITPSPQILQRAIDRDADWEAAD